MKFNRKNIFIKKKNIFKNSQSECHLIKKYFTDTDDIKKYKFRHKISKIKFHIYFLIFLN